MSITEEQRARRRPRPIANFKNIMKEAANWGELRHTPYGMGPALILAAVGFFSIFDGRAFGLAGPNIAQELRISIQEVFAIGSVIGTFSVFTGIYAGYLADRMRRVPFLAIGTIGSGVFSILSSRAQGLASFAVPRYLDNLSSEAASVPTFSLLADYYPPEARGRVFAVLGTLSRAGGFFANAVVGIVVTALGWRTSTALFGSPLIVVGLISLFVLKEPVRGYFERKEFGADEAAAQKEVEPLSFGEAWRTLWAVRTLRRIFLANIWLQAGGVVYGSLYAFFLVERYGLNILARSLLSYPNIIAGFIGGFIGGGLIDVLTKRSPSQVLRVVASFGFIAAFGMAFAALGPPLPLLIAFGAIEAFGGALVGPAVGAITAQVIPPNIRTQGLQTFALASLPASIIFLPLAGQLQLRYGFTGAMMFAVPLTLIGVAIQVTAASFFDRDRRNAGASAMATEVWRKTRAEGAGKLLVCRGVDVEYDGVQVLFDVDFDVDDGELIAILGTNGAGKSTLLKAISGTQEASSGAIVFDGRDISHMPPNEVANRGVIHMPGGRGVFPGLSVRENLLMGRWMLTDVGEAREHLKNVYEIFPVLKERAEEPAGSLSGGEQQMLSLAQAFLSKPRLLMIDELSMGLSPAVVNELLEIVKRINQQGVSIIVVEQSVSVALNIAKRAIFMEKGEVKFDGRTEDLLNRPEILRAVYVKGTGAIGGSVHAGLKEGSKIGAPVLEVQGLVKSYGGVTAVDGVSFELREREVLGLIGPNGAGKTTIFDLISGYQIPDEGIVKYEGVDITNLRPEERARRKLIRRFQDARLFPSLSVHEALLVALEQKLEVKNPLLTMSQLPGPRRAERRIRAQADKLLELLGLESYRGKFVRELSTGVRRILDIGCVLASEPKVLLLDEPSTGIAQTEAAGLGPLLLQVRAETGCSILIIEHTMSLIAAVSDELIALDQGKVIMRGTPDEVLNDNRVIEAYLGGSEASINR